MGSSKFEMGSRQFHKFELEHWKGYNSMFNDNDQWWWSIQFNDTSNVLKPTATV